MSLRNRFVTAVVVGGVPGLVVFLWLLTAGTFRLLAWHTVGDFYDVQAHALLHGHLDVPASRLGIEGFQIGDRTYMYQGPVPALLRLPVALVTDHLDGRLTRLMMLLATLVIVAGASRIVWQVRRRVRGDAPMGELEFVLVAGWTFVLLAGSPLTFTASRAWVYHEAISWGVAFAVLAFSVLVDLAERPTRRRVVLATVLTALALLSRASVGLGPVVAAGLLAAVVGLRWARTALADRRDRPAPVPADGGWTGVAPGRTPTGRSGLVRVVALGAIAVLPVLAYCAVNLAKFHTLTSVPWASQRYSADVTPRKEFLAANSDFFGLQYVPGTLSRYLRPDAIRIGPAFPFVAFEPAVGDSLVGSVRFDTLDVWTGLPASAPFVLAVAAIGAAVVFGRSARRRHLRALRLPALGAAFGAALIFPYGFIAQRFFGDWLPLIVVLGGAGVVACAIPSPRHRAVRAAGAGLLGLFALWSVLVNPALALRYQRELSLPTPGLAAVSDYVDRQLGFALTYRSAADLDLVRAPTLPRWGPAGQLFVVGDCEAFYLSTGARIDEATVTAFVPVEGTGAAGYFDLTGDLQRLRVGERAPLVSGGTPTAPSVIWMERVDDGHAVVGWDGSQADQHIVGDPFPLPSGHRARVQVRADPRLDSLLVEVDGRIALMSFFDPPVPDRVGRNDVSPDVAERFPGGLTAHRQSTALCRRAQPFAIPVG